MTKIQISQSQKDALAAARRAGESRTYLWSAIRRQYGIPVTLRIAVTTERHLYVKGTNPKQYLLLGANGQYSHAAPVADDKPAPAANVSRFLVATQVPVQPTGWSRVSVGSLLDYLRNGESETIDDNVNPPAGFPTDVPGDALVFDSEGGFVYFRT